MTTLISSEWYKLFRGRVLVLILAGEAAETLIQILGNYTAGDNGLLGQHGVLMAPGKSFVLEIWFAAFAGFFVASEFQHGTIRNVLALGKNRTRVYLSKLLSVCMATAAILAVVSIVGTAGLSLAFGFGDMAPDDYLRFFSWNFLMQLLYHMTYAAMFTMFAFLSRNTGLTILLGIGYMIGTQVLIAFLSNYPGGRTAFVLKFFPEYYISAFGSLSGDPAFVANGIFLCAAYFAIIGIIGCIVFKKSDIR